ncbi:MAG: hypothetical protein JWM71_691 [Solirubrobacteraceae bacterium]|nr:hypothetical protein [Solirubrobacteraceae bacterium]
MLLKEPMRRSALIVSLLALIGASAASVAHGQPGTRPPLRANLVACETGTNAADRYAVFTGSMPSATGVASMQMRFDLAERTPGSAWAGVSLPHWGVWEKTDKAGVPGFIFTKRVQQLAAPAAFRATIDYRWIDAKGKVLRTAHRLSPVCRQPDPRPDLHVKRVIFSGKGPTRVVVVNRGRGDATAFGVTVTRAAFSVSKAVDALPAGAQRTLGFPIGRCTAGEPIQVTLDPAGAVDEADEADDSVTVSCPER